MWPFQTTACSSLTSPHFLLCSLCLCTQTSNFCLIVGWRSRKLSPQLLFAPRISLHISAHFLWGRSMQRGAERPPYEHLCVSKITGWEWADGMTPLRGWRRWLLKDGYGESGTDEVFFFYFILWYSRILSDTYQSFSVCGYFQSPHLSLGAHLPWSAIFYFLSPVQSFNFTLNSADWSTQGHQVANLIPIHGSSFSSHPYQAFTSLGTQPDGSAFNLLVSHILLGF